MPDADERLESVLAEHGIIPLLGGSCTDLVDMLSDVRRIAAGGRPPETAIKAAPFLRSHRIDIVPQYALVGENDGAVVWAGMPLLYAPHHGWCRTATGYLRLELPASLKRVRL